MPPQTTAVVLLSGGLDSAVALAWARREGLACLAVSFDYGQRHRAELAAAGRLAQRLGALEHRTIAVDLRTAGGSALTDEIAVPKNKAQAGGIPPTYVPARNLIFLSLAAGYAEARGAKDLVIGVNAVDYSGYPDCRPGFIRAFEQTLNQGTKLGVEGGAWRVRTPLIELSKAGIIALGSELGVDFSLTHSCYDPDPRGLACGACESCAIRRRGFAEAGVDDPTRYAAGQS